MTNIDYFKQDISVGDIASIELTSGKTVQGKVIEISECIIIEKEDGKKMRLLDAIIGGWELISSGVIEQEVKSNVENVESPQSELKAQEEVKIEPTESTIPGLKILGKIDVSKFEKKNRFPSIIPVPKQESSAHVETPGNSIESSKMKTVGNSLQDLASVAIPSPTISYDSKFLSAHGRITGIGPAYGFIVEKKTKAVYKFENKEIIGEIGDFNKGDDVVFTPLSTLFKGSPAAGKVLNELSVKELMLNVRDLLQDGRSSYKRRAKDILEYILDEFPDYLEAKTLLSSIAQSNNNKEIVKPDIVISADTIAALPLRRPMMSEYDCKEMERELDLLIRNGQREECLQKSYDILSRRCPTPKYLKSYLDRIVNTEVALDHTTEAIEALAQLIAFSETQDTKPTNLSHLYISLARLLKKQGKFSEATKSLDCAESLNPDSTLVETMREQIKQESDFKANRLVEMEEVELEPETIADDSIVVSKMLQQDVEFLASSIETTETDPQRLLDRADSANKDSNKTFESRAQLYLDAAAAFYKRGDKDSPQYKKAVANYARHKGNSMYLRLQNAVHRFPENIDELIAYSDSACNYYTEALGIYNGFGQKRYLQELFLKYLKLRKVSSQIQGGKTPDPDWSSGTLKSNLKECLNDVKSEEFKDFVYTCISVGSAAEGAWNSLAFDKDGIGPFMSKLGDDDFRASAFHVFNIMEHSNISEDVKTNEFLQGIFKHRQDRIDQLASFFSDRLKWQFSQFDIESFKNEWNAISGFSDILLTTDKKAIAGINQVINTLMPYANLNDSNRMQRLISSQQTLLKSIEAINDTTTYYGRTFFYQLGNKWLRSISRFIEEKYEESQPKLVVEPDPHFIKIGEDGTQHINFVVINNGESTADSFIVKISSPFDSAEIKYSDTLDADKSVALSWTLPTLISEDSVNIRFEVITSFNGRILPALLYENTFEKDNNIPFKSDIPWTIDGTPEDKVFVGREEKLDKLVRHYLSKERSHTYIMYGLTRTGKTSILDYLREKIQGQPLAEDATRTIMAFSWPFQNVAYKKDIEGVNERRFWEYLVKTSLYEKLPENIQDAIDASYSDGNIPEIVSQNDFLKIIDVLNDNRIMPFFAVDEFANVRTFIKGGTLNASFLSILRDLSLEGKACFIYAGTYDIKELPRNEEYGITGQLVHTRPLEINSISDKDADKLIDSWDELKFEPRAKEYIKNLSGRVPYWIQWICLDCGKYAIAHNYHHLGYNEVNKVVQVLTGEVSSFGDDSITWEKIDEANFQQNQYMPGENEDAELAVISCIAYINRGNYEHTRGVSIKDMRNIWEKYDVTTQFQQKMMDAIKRMVERCTLTEYSDEGRQVFKINVDLFRRYWYAAHKNIATYLTLK